MADEPKTNVEDAVRFLEWKRPGGPWPITAIVPDGERTPTTWLDRADALRAFVVEHSGRANLHYTVAEVRRGVKRKPRKKELIETDFLHADLDPPKTNLSAAEIDAWIDAEVTRIGKLTAVPPPSLIACSGNGLHLLWRLDAPLFIGGTEERWTEVESRNRWIVRELSGDGGTWNCDRLLKLYGSINVPDAKKRKAGRVERETRVIEMNALAYPLADFGVVEAEPTRAAHAAPAAARSDVGRLTDIDELAEWGIGEADRLRVLIVQGCDPDKFDGDRSKVVCDLCCHLHRRGVPASLIAGIISDPAWPISEHVIDKGKGDTTGYAWRQVERAVALVEAEGRIRPRVVYDENVLPRVVDEAEAALLASDIPLYQMSGRLVQPVRLDASSSDDQQVRRDAGALIIHDLNEHRLLEHMIAAADFVKQSRNAKGDLIEKPYAPPLKFAKHYAERVGAWRLPVLAGISTIPTMRVDGSVVSANGYDAASRLIIDTEGVIFPTVPDQPTRDEALAALDALVDPIAEFPFVQDDEDDEPGGDRPSTSRSAALAMLLTAVARPALRSAPIFGLSAPTMETGKSLLADVAAMMVTGRWATKMSQGATEEEDEKRLLSVLMKGDPVNVIDNIAREVSGDALCSILTEERWSGRWLGQSRMVEVSTRALFIANGNNLVFREDMAVRAVMVSLDAQMERPGERVFQRDLKEYVPGRRVELVTAALTILCGYVVAGRPKPAHMKPSRFADWDLIRGALLWLGEPDPWETQARVTAGDSARAELVALMTAFRDAFGAGEFVSTSDIIAHADEEYQVDQRPGALGLALSAACSGRSGVTAVGLGKYLKSKRDRRHEGMWIRAHEDAKNGNRYAVMAEMPRAAQGALL